MANGKLKFELNARSEDKATIRRLEERFKNLTQDLEQSYLTNANLRSELNDPEKLNDVLDTISKKKKRI